MIPSEFHRVVGQFLQRLGVPLPKPREAYRIRFAGQTPVYLMFRPDRWLELLAPAGRAATADAARIATALLELDARQSDGVLLCTSMDEGSGAVSVRARLPLEACHAEQVIEALERLRGHAATARSLLANDTTARPGEHEHRSRRPTPDAPSH